MPQITAQMVNDFFDQYERQLQQNSQAQTAASQPQQKSTLGRLLSAAGPVVAGIGGLTGNRALQGIGAFGSGVSQGQNQAFAQNQQNQLANLQQQRQGLNQTFTAGLGASRLASSIEQNRLLEENRIRDDAAKADAAGALKTQRGISNAFEERRLALAEQLASSGLSDAQLRLRAGDARTTGVRRLGTKALGQLQALNPEQFEKESVDRNVPSFDNPIALGSFAGTEDFQRRDSTGTGFFGGTKFGDPYTDPALKATLDSLSYAQGRSVDDIIGGGLFGGLGGQQGTGGLRNQAVGELIKIVGDAEWNNATPEKREAAIAKWISENANAQ